MKRLSFAPILVLLLALLVACAPGTEPVSEATPAAPEATEPEPTVAEPAEPPPTEMAPTATDTAEPDTPTPESEEPTETSTPESEATATPEDEAQATLAPDEGVAEDGELITEEEAILILEPGNGSRVTGPVRVAGEADSTFEQNLVARIVDLQNQELALEPTIIDAELGQRGPFEFEIPVDVEEEQQVFIQVFSTSARDGGVTHLSSVGVTLAPDGEEEIVTATPHPEDIVIDEPANGDTVSGGLIEVSGRGLASFEQTLVVELLDAQGQIVDSEPIIVDSIELGEPGPFTAELSYTIDESLPARIVVRDPSPAFGGDAHLASVEVMLETGQP